MVKRPNNMAKAWLLRLQERDHEIENLKAACKAKDDEIFGLRNQLKQSMSSIINPPVFETQQKLKQLEGQVLSYGKFIHQEKEKNRVLKAQLHLASRAMAQFFKPTA